jgi:predicted permease
VHIDPPALAGQTLQLQELYGRFRTELLKVPGVVRVGYALYGPMEGSNWSSTVSISGRPVNPAHLDYSSWNRVGPGYFESLGTRILRGRSVDERDSAGAPRVAVVSDAFVRKFFDNVDPIGQTVGVGDASHVADFTIVGVVEDVKYTAPTRPARPMLFLSAFQTVTYATPGSMNSQGRSMLLGTIVLQAAAGASNLDGGVRQALARVNPDVNVMRVLPLADQVGSNFRLERLMASLTSFYGVLALALAALGLYGITAYGVSQRTREIGVRMALGAGRARIIRTFIVGPLVQALIGLSVGVPLALLAGRSMASQLYGTSGQSPAIYLVAIAVLTGSAAIAAAIPARRAASVDPTRALRGE